MYKGKDFGTPFKKKGVPLLPLKKISTWGWYLYGIAPPKAALRHIVTGKGKRPRSGRLRHIAALTRYLLDNHLLYLCITFNNYINRYNH